jgi:hypothetical protein
MSQATTSKRTLKITYGYHGCSNRMHPQINVGGFYLTQFGFKVGDFVELSLENGQIVIKKIVR